MMLIYLQQLLCGQPLHLRTTIALDDELVRQAEHYTWIKEKAALDSGFREIDGTGLPACPLLRSGGL